MQRRHVALMALSLFWMMAGCDPTTTTDAAPQFDIELGLARTTPFAELPDTNFEMEAGLQGGYHFLFTARVIPAPAADSAVLEARVYDQNDELITRARFFRRVSDKDGEWTAKDLLVRMPIPEEIKAHDVRLVVNILDAAEIPTGTTRVDAVLDWEPAFADTDE